MQKNILKNIIKVTASNCLSIISGIAIGFLIPMILSVEAYGYYKAFTLYCTYAGLCSLGIVDGIVLQYGGLDYEDLEPGKFRGLFKIYVLIHLIIIFFASCAAVISSDSNVKFILLYLALNTLFLNVIGYYQQISQITQRFNELAIIKIIHSLLNVISAAGLFVVYRKGITVKYQYYIMLIVSINCMLSGWYIYTYRHIIFGHSDDFNNSLKETRLNIIKGFPLLFANMCATLILTLDRQFVSVLFDVPTYAVYAFAYNMLSLITVATSAVSTVLYPTLKRTDISKIGNIYNNLVSIILVFLFAALLIYFPLCQIIRWILPKYINSLPILRIILPGLAFSSVVTVIMHNIYKAVGDNVRYFKKSLVVLAVSAVANYLAYKFVGTTPSISIASIITMLFWFYYVESDIKVRYKLDNSHNHKYMLLMIAAFYLVTCIRNEIVSGLIYLSCFAIFTFMFFYSKRDDLISMIKK